MINQPLSIEIRIFHITGIFIFLLINFSCSKGHVELPIERIHFDGDKTQGIIDKVVIIRDSLDYKKYSQIFNELCDSLKIPNIDFNENSVIGKTIVIDEVCHLLGSETRVYKTKENIVVYEIEIIHAGLCKSGHLVWSYSIVPKLNLIDSVQFNVEYSRDWFYID